MAIYKSASALKAAIQKKAASAMTEIVDRSFQTMHNNVDNFYNSPGGIYKHTGQLAKSPQIDYCNLSGNKMSAQLSLDTSYTYVPSGRDTATIYGYAENGGLLGNGMFWFNTIYDIPRFINEEMNRAGFQKK